MDFLHSLIQNSSFPLLTALLLGFMTTISPCPLCTNITAIGYLSKNVQSKRLILLNGLTYSFGKIAAFTALASVFLLGGSVLPIQHFFETYGEMLLGPFLILGGLFMLEFFKFHKHSDEHHDDESFSEKVVNKSKPGNPAWSFVLGVVFSFAFCPYSGVLYFGGLIPMTLADPLGLLLPVVFAIGASLPVVFISWLLAYSLSGIGDYYDRIQSFEIIVRRVTAIVFLLVGIYVLVEYFTHLGHIHTH